jgi:FtsZ-binding cell division protein ZapB
MISLEQIRLLEGKISRAIELIRVLKEENATLRRGLDSAQNRMKELESLVDGFKTDQKEIEGVIVRALRHLDDLEATPAAAAPAKQAPPAADPPVAAARAQAPGPARQRAPAAEPVERHPDAAAAPAKEELDIF